MACEWDVNALICVAGNYYVIINEKFIRIWLFSVAGIIAICWLAWELNNYFNRNK